jgi:hypothetical protein
MAVHDFWTNTGFGEWHWEASGGVLIFVDGPDLVGDEAGSVFPGIQYGEFSSGDDHCTFEAPAEVNAAVTGSCDNGVLTLEVTEDWQMGTYVWQCDGDAPVQFDLPPMGSSSHPNLKFTLIEGGSETVEIPWGGGSGTKSWTLMPAMEPSP